MINSKWIGKHIPIPIPLSRCAISLVSCCLFSSISAASSVEEISNLLKQGDSKAAYMLAQQHEDEQAGEPLFDFYYGMAALNNGKPELAAFAFERILYLHPQSPRVELELARAYFNLADWDRAESAFKRGLSAEMPTSTQNLVKQYLEKITALKKRSKSRSVGHFSLRLGDDSNINSATDEDLFTIDQGGSIFDAGVIDEDDQERGDNFVNANINWQKQNPLSKISGYFYGGGLDYQAYADESDFSFYRINAQAGYQTRKDKWSIRIPVQLNAFWRDGEKENQTLGLSTEVMRPINKRWSGFGFTRLSANRYPEVKERDVDSFYLGGGVIAKYGAIQWIVNLMLGDESAKIEDVNGKSVTGAVVSMQWTLAQNQLLKFGGMILSSEHDAETLGIVREDDFTRLSAAWSYRYSKKFTLSIDGSVVENESNLSVYAYEKVEIALGVDYEF